MKRSYGSTLAYLADRVKLSKENAPAPNAWGIDELYAFQPVYQA